MVRLIFAFLLSISSFTGLVAEDISNEHGRKTLEIYRTIVEVDTSKTMGNVPRVARYLADELVAAGFSEKDVRVITKGSSAALVAHYRGDDSSGKRPILLLGHLDVVEAYAKDWERPPFTLTSDGVYYYARGSEDNKFGIAQLTSTFIRLKNEGFVPNRDLIIAFSGDEESAMATTRLLAFEVPELANAEYALNSDAGSGTLNDAGQAINYEVQAAEKTYATWEITATNPGGHSSMPRQDNAIYDLAEAISAIHNYQFPVRWSEMTLAYFQAMGEQLGGELGDAMIRFAYDPKNKAAASRIAQEPAYIGTSRTTCVPTMLNAGHAENALPQSATVTVNCRIFPGDSIATIETELQGAVENEALQFKLISDLSESPISEPRKDVIAAVSKAIHTRYKGLPVIPYMSSGATDAMHFRAAGIPTWGIGSIFMHPDDNFAHGLNERVPIKAFHDALDHWSIILRELAGNRD